MRVSNLIKKLQHFQEHYGDLTVYQTDYGNGKSFLIIEWEKE